MEKPRNRMHAVEMLRQFCGQSVRVATAICIVRNSDGEGKAEEFADEATLIMRSYDDDAINAYLFAVPDYQ